MPIYHAPRFAKLAVAHFAIGDLLMRVVDGADHEGAGGGFWLTIHQVTPGPLGGRQETGRTDPIPEDSFPADLGLYFERVESVDALINCLLSIKTALAGVEQAPEGEP